MNRTRCLPVVALVLAWSPAAFADVSISPVVDDRDCTPVCAGTCVKPLVVPDRWDDGTVLPGHEGWADNGHFDHEAFTDLDGNGHYDAGEVFVDTNGNGVLDEEFYHPVLTGYVPDPVPGHRLAPEGDLGRLLVLRSGRGEALVASHYSAAVLPAINKGTPQRGARAFGDALEFCMIREITEQGDWLELEPGSMAGVVDAALRTIHERDPLARWDPVTATIVDSQFDGAHQQRLFLIPLVDPRVEAKPGRSLAQVVKIAAFFLEAPGGNGVVTGRFLKVRAPNHPCGCQCAAQETFLRACP